jgi:Vitamin K-dependent gamma-carboxylase
VSRLEHLGISRDYFKLDLGIFRPDRWLFQPGSARRLAAVRIALCALLALRVGLRPGLYLDLSQQEASLFRPLSWAKLFDHMPSRGVLFAALVICVVAGLCASAGFKGRIALPIAWVAGVFLNGFLTSQGKVVHNDVLLLLCMFILIPARHSDAWSVDAWLARRRGASPSPDRSVRYGWPIRTAMVLVAFTYFLTGLHKIQYTGISWASSDNLRWVLYTASDSQNGNSLGLFIANHPLLSHVFAWGTLIVECTFPIALLWPVSRWFYVPGVVGMHAGIYATMHLNYVAMASTVIIVYVNWSWIADRLRERSRARGRLRPAAVRT